MKDFCLMACLDMRPLYLVIIQYFLARAKKYSLNTKSLMVFNIGSIFSVIDLAVAGTRNPSCAGAARAAVILFEQGRNWKAPRHPLYTITNLTSTQSWFYVRTELNHFDW